MSDNGRSPTNSISISSAQKQKATSAQSQLQPESQSQSQPQPQSHVNPIQEQREHQQQQPSSHQAATHSNAQPTSPSTSKPKLAASNPSTPSQKPSSTKSSSSSILPIPIPGPLKKLFDRFPLITYPPNELPLRAPVDRQRHYRQRRRQRQWQQQQHSLHRQGGRDSEEEEEHTLYVFTSEDGAKLGLPSFNPGCLKWQAYLKFQGIRFRTVKSNNHASPNGILPFLIPAGTNASSSTTTTTMMMMDVPISSAGLKRWADGQGTSHITSVGGGESGSKERNGLIDARNEAYMSLINSYIRRAWLHNLYCNQSNFASVAYPRYIQSASSNNLLQASLASTLRNAAIAELLKQDTSISSSSSSNSTSKIMDQDGLYEQADEAFEALAVRLGSCDEDGKDNKDDKVKWLSGRERPGLADAALFAYTHLLLDEGMGWTDRRMVEMLRVRERESIVRHRERILEMFF